MFSPTIIDINRGKLEEKFQPELLRLGLKGLEEHTPSEVEGWKDRLSDSHSSKGVPARGMTVEEQRFVLNELLMTRVSFPYWAERYATINIDGSGLSGMFPLMDSQRFVLQRIAKVELEGHTGARHPGVFINVLKASRQVGVSTLFQAIIAYLLTQQNNRFGLIASAVPEDSSYLYGMFRRFVDNLPNWLRPGIVTDRNTFPEEVEFDGGSNLWSAAGKSMKGSEGRRGQLGRGRTISACHLSELSTWDNPEQINGSLLPTFPLSSSTFVGFESTAKGRGNWWHKHWDACKKVEGVPAFTNIFIPWYVEPKYSLEPPPSWSPLPSTEAHARRVEDTSLRWAGRKLTPAKPQLYWYERKRAEAEAMDDYTTFLEEYGAVDDDECFQFAGKSVFKASALQRIQEQMKPIVAAYEILPQKDLL